MGTRRLKADAQLNHGGPQRVQITSGGLRVYLEAVESAFFEDVDYAVLQKIYGSDVDGARRYSPARSSARLWR